MQLHNKTVVITGGSDGLGFSLAKAFAVKGAKVCIIGRNQEKVEKAVKELGKDARGFIADVSKYPEIEKVATQIKEVDILINNAGIWLEGQITDNSPEEITTALDVNLKGVIFATKAFLPQLKKTEETHIINVSSTSGLKGRENQAVYAASKFGVTGFTESLKNDLAKTPIKVTGFYPGGMSTNLFKRAGSPKENSDWMNTDKVAEVVVFMVERDVTMIMDHVVVNKRGAKTTN